MGCNTCKSKGTSVVKNNTSVNNVNDENVKISIFEKTLNLLFRIFVFLLVLGLILPIMIPLTIAVIFNVIFVTHSFDIVSGIRKIIKYLEKKFNFSFKDTDEADYDDYYDEDEWEINENEVTIIKEKEDVK